MSFVEIQMEQWARKDHYEHYKNNVPCSYSLTVDVDITNLLIRSKEQDFKVYPAQIYMLATIVNQFTEFRTTTNEKHRLGYWEVIDPMYTVLNPDTETFSAVWTKYHRCFHTFYQACLKDMAQYGSGVLFPQRNLPANIFNVSSIPWLDFTGFNLNLFSGKDYLLPIFTIGKHKKENEKTLMPLAIQCHHAVCDGYHVGKFTEKLRKMAANPEQWL